MQFKGGIENIQLHSDINIGDSEIAFSGTKKF